MSDTMVQTDDFLTHFRQLEQELEASGPSWLRRTRREHLDRFNAIGFPTTREEAWRNTNVAAIASASFRPAPQRALDEQRVPGLARLDLGGPRAVFVDGRLDRELSTLDVAVDGVRIETLAQALERDGDWLRTRLTEPDASRAHAFRALNTAFGRDGAVVSIEDGAVVDAPIHLVFLSSGGGDAEGRSVTHPRTVIAVGEGAQGFIVESYLDASPRGGYLTNAVTQLSLARGAVLDHVRLQHESDSAFHVAAVETSQQADSRYRACHLQLGGRLVRNELSSTLAGTGANCEMDGLVLLSGKQHVDNQTVLDHASPHCDSRELFKTILGGHSRSVFNGRIIVRPDAQKTDAKQSNPNLLLSSNALAHTRPQLEIYADDVKCTHGATIGQLDQQAIFYLRSRGIPEETARNLIVEAFAGEILDRLGVETLRGLLRTTVVDRLTEL
jgi:Fe-S cluster assembly protein SufD